MQSPLQSQVTEIGGDEFLYYRISVVVVVGLVVVVVDSPAVEGLRTPWPKSRTVRSTVVVFKERVSLRWLDRRGSGPCGVKWCSILIVVVVVVVMDDHIVDCLIVVDGQLHGVINVQQQVGPAPVAAGGL